MRRKKIYKNILLALLVINRMSSGNALARNRRNSLPCTDFLAKVVQSKGPKAFVPVKRSASRLLPTVS